MQCPLYKIKGGRNNSFSMNVKNCNIKGITCFVLPPKLLSHHMADGCFFKGNHKIKTYVWKLSFQMAATRVLPHGETGI